MPRWATLGAPIVGVALAAGLAIQAWKSPAGILTLLVFPLLLNIGKWRWYPALAASAYFGVGAITIGAGIASTSGLVSGVAVAITLTAVSALPFGLYRADATPLSRFWRMVAALALLTLPPVGLVAPQNPLYLAGLLYPGLGIAGLIATAGLLASLAGGGVSLRAGRRAVGAVGAGAAIAAGFALSTATPPKLLFNWLPASTGIAPGIAGAPADASRAIRLRLGGGAQVLVLPPGLVSWKDLDRGELRGAIEAAGAAGATVIIGVDDGQGGIDVVAAGAQSGLLRSAPLGWRLSPVSLIRSSSGDRSVAISVGHESITIWPNGALLAGAAEDTGLVAMTNAWAFTGTHMENVHDVAPAMLARLAGVDLVRTMNRDEH